MKYLILFTIFILAVYFLWGYAVINDITTTPENPPQFHHAKKFHKNKSDFSYQKYFYPELKPVYLNLTQSKAFSILNNHFKNGKKTGHLIELTYTTPLMKFKDDVVIEIRNENNNKSSVHIRSASRVGKGDFGTNYQRVVTIRNQIDKLFKSL